MKGGGSDSGSGRKIGSGGKGSAQGGSTGESGGGMMGGGPTMGGSNESGTMGGGSTGRSDGEVGAAEKKDPNQDVFNTRLISRVLPLIVLALISNNFTRPSRCLLAQT